MTILGRQNLARAGVLGIMAWIALATAGGACSSGGARSDAGATGGGGASAGSGGASAAGSGGAGTGGVAGSVGGAGAASGGMGGTAAGGGGATGAGASGGAGAGGTGGGLAGTCTFDVQHMPSWAIGTVEIVTWTLDVPSLTEAHIDFGPAGAAPTMTAPVNLGDPQHRTLLLGMKGGKPYTFRVVATDGTKTCTSPDFSLTTGAVPATAPKIMKTAPGTGAAKGFIVTSTGVDVGNASRGQPDAYIFDTDGDVVWWSSSALYGSPNGVTRAHISWDGAWMWIMTGSNAKIESVSMDGVTTTDYTNVIKRAHHDFAVLPSGAIATLLDATTAGGAQSIVEMKPDGTITPIVADLATLYRSGYYPNSIHYYPADDSFTLSDRSSSTNLYVKFKHSGDLVWQFGGSNPIGKSFTLVGLDQWRVNHGHHLTADGHFLFFNNQGTTGTGTEMPWVKEVLLDETAGTATLTWQYQFTNTAIAIALGDAERLPNGNSLVTNSMGGLIQEVDRSGAIVQSFKNTTFGYVDFRTSLYGPPSR